MEKKIIGIDLGGTSIKLRLFLAGESSTNGRFLPTF